MKSTLVLYRKGLCGFFWFWDSPWKKSYVEKSVASIMDQREYDFGNFENCELSSEMICSIIDFHSALYHMCRNLHKRASLILCHCVPLVHSDPDPVIAERDVPLQMVTHW